MPTGRRESPIREIGFDFGDYNNVVWMSFECFVCGYRVVVLEITGGRTRVVHEEMHNFKLVRGHLVCSRESCNASNRVVPTSALTDTLSSCVDMAVAGTAEPLPRSDWPTVRVVNAPPPRPRRQAPTTGVYDSARNITTGRGCND